MIIVIVRAIPAGINELVDQSCWVIIFNICRAIGPWSEGICDNRKKKNIFWRLNKCQNFAGVWDFTYDNHRGRLFSREANNLRPTGNVSALRQIAVRRPTTVTKLAYFGQGNITVAQLQQQQLSLHHKHMVTV